MNIPICKPCWITFSLTRVCRYCEGQGCIDATLGTPARLCTVCNATGVESLTIRFQPTSFDLSDSLRGSVTFSASDTEMINVFIRQYDSVDMILPIETDEFGGSK